MPNENQNNDEPIGDATPIELPKRPGALEKAATLLAVSGGSALVLALLAAPTRTSGATRSSKLKWQQCQAEPQATAAQTAMEPNAGSPIPAQQRAADPAK